MVVIAGMRVGSHEIFDLQEEPGSQEEESALDIMAFPENVFAGILESLPPDQLLNVSRVRLLSHAPSSSTFLSKISGCWFCASSPEGAVPLHPCTSVMEPTKDTAFCEGEQAVCASQRGCLGEGMPHAQVVSAQVPPGRSCFHPVSLASPVQVASSMQLLSRQSCQDMPATLNLILCILLSSKPLLSDIGACTGILWCGVCSALKLACLSHSSAKGDPSAMTSHMACGAGSMLA